MTRDDAGNQALIREAIPEDLEPLGSPLTRACRFGRGAGVGDHRRHRMGLGRSRPSGQVVQNQGICSMLGHAFDPGKLRVKAS